MSNWHWVRHGPTHEKALVGWRDVPADLSDKERIARLRHYLPDDALMVSSDLIRAAATGDALQGPGHIRLPNAAELREFNFGLWDGMHFSAVAERDPALSRAYWETPGDIAPPNGESWNAAAKRVNEFVDRVNRDHPASTIIAVAHIGVILTQVQRGLGVSAYEALSHTIDNLSSTSITLTGATPKVEIINHCP